MSWKKLFGEDGEKTSARGLLAEDAGIHDALVHGRDSDALDGPAVGWLLLPPAARVVAHEAQSQGASMTPLTKEARLLLLWLVARKHGLVRNISASHEDALLFIGCLGNAHEQLRVKGCVTDDGAHYEVTEEGERRLREGS